MDCFFVVVLSGISFIFLPRKVCRMGPKKAIIHLWAVGNLCSPIYINLCKYWNTAELKAYISWFVNATHTNTHGWNNKKILWCDMRRINPVKCQTCLFIYDNEIFVFSLLFFFKCNEFSRRSIFVDKQISATRNQRKKTKRARKMPNQRRKMEVLNGVYNVTAIIRMILVKGFNCRLSHKMRENSS